jgi:hypothetical protein
MGRVAFLAMLAFGVLEISPKRLLDAVGRGYEARWCLAEASPSASELLPDMRTEAPGLTKTTRAIRLPGGFSRPRNMQEADWRTPAHESMRARRATVGRLWRCGYSEGKLGVLVTVARRA